ncbi:hypothetical protein A2U01_0009065 [Trifolium medium]|uniref:C3H1-type domain-containing protein n=1 Tax=Trifolium medium TaxID=97028 RepID=A0A392MKY8_9FABA|nr:hypothetical protein [Trifolium medium]
MFVLYVFSEVVPGGIMLGREFSNAYIDQAQQQAERCRLCRGNAFPGITFTMHIPEDLCVKCLLLIAKQTSAFYSENNYLAGRVADLEQVLQVKYKSRMCHHWENGNCLRGDACRFAHGEAELAGNG